MKAERSPLPRLALLAVGVASCSLLVAGEAEPLRCSLEGRVGPPACDAGFVCESGVCQAISAAGASNGGEGPGLAD